MKRFALSFVLLAAFSVPAAAQVQFTNSFLTSDAHFNAIYNGNGLLYEAFGAEGRAGNRAIGGDYEYGINRRLLDNTFQFGAASGQRVLVSGTTYQFRLEYDGDASPSVRWRIFAGSDSPPVATISTTANFGQVNDLMVRTAVNSVDRTILVNNINFNGTPLVGAQSFSNGPTVRDYLRINNFDFTQSWFMTGDMTMTWGATPPTASQINFQIKAMQSVPEPATIGLGLAVLASGLGYWRYRRRTRQLETDAEAASDGVQEEAD